MVIKGKDILQEELDNAEKVFIWSPREFIKEANKGIIINDFNVLDRNKNILYQYNGTACGFLT
jgi:hypothetical protein